MYTYPFTQALSTVSTSFRPAGGALDPRQFEGSFFAFLRVVTGLYSLDSPGVDGMDNGPVHGCGICAPIPGEGIMDNFPDARTNSLFDGAQYAFPPHHVLAHLFADTFFVYNK